MLQLFLLSYTATPEIYPLSLHDALPISAGAGEKILAKHPLVGPIQVVDLNPAVASIGDVQLWRGLAGVDPDRVGSLEGARDRKSTRLNSSHVAISYAVFCLKKKISSVLY